MMVVIPARLLLGGWTGGGGGGGPAFSLWSIAFHGTGVGVREIGRWQRHGWVRVLFDLHGVVNVVVPGRGGGGGG